MRKATCLSSYCRTIHISQVTCGRQKLNTGLWRSTLNSEKQEAKLIHAPHRSPTVDLSLLQPRFLSLQQRFGTAKQKNMAALTADLLISFSPGCSGRLLAVTLAIKIKPQAVLDALHTLEGGQGRQLHKAA